MRDTFLLLLVGAILVYSALLMHQSRPARGLFPNNVSEHSQSNPSIGAHLKRGGTTNDKRSRSRFSLESKGSGENEGTRNENERASWDASEIESLPSIYPEQDHRKSLVTPRVARTSKKKLVLHGVPVDSWILSQKDRIHSGSLESDEGNEMRFLLWCMELKKRSVEYVGVQDCKTITQHFQQGSSRPLGDGLAGRPANTENTASSSRY